MTIVLHLLLLLLHPLLAHAHTHTPFAPLTLQQYAAYPHVAPSAPSATPPNPPPPAPHPPRPLLLITPLPNAPTTICAPAPYSHIGHCHPLPQQDPLPDLHAHLNQSATPLHTLFNPPLSRLISHLRNPRALLLAHSTVSQSISDQLSRASAPPSRIIYLSPCPPSGPAANVRAGRLDFRPMSAELGLRRRGKLVVSSVNGPWGTATSLWGHICVEEVPGGECLTFDKCVLRTQGGLLHMVVRALEQFEKSDCHT